MPSLEEWAARYEQKTGSAFRYDPAAERLEFDPDHGFMTWGIDQYHRAFVVGKVVGNGKHWRRVTDALAAEYGPRYGLIRIMTLVRRDPRVYLRKGYGTKVYAWLLEEPLNREEVVPDGRRKRDEVRSEGDSL